MFMTLLKHEWRATKDVLGLLCLIILGSGAAIGGSSFYLAWTAENRFSGNDSVLTAFASILLAAAAAMAIAFLLLLMAYNSQIIWADVCAAVPELWESFLRMWANSWRNLLWFAGAVVSTGIAWVILLMLAVAIGSVIAKRHKILTALGVYWLISLVRNAAYGVGLMTVGSGRWMIQYPFYSGAVIILCGYFLMYWLVDKKLNLN